jgi:hypothetical protein
MDASAGSNPAGVTTSIFKAVFVQLVYVPATRDGAAVTRQALRQLLRRLERSGDFGADAEEDVQDLSDELQEHVEGLPAVEWMNCHDD